MPRDPKRPEKLTGRSRRKLSYTEVSGGESNPQRTKENLDLLRRGLFLPEGTYKYAPIATNEIRLLHLLPADNKGDMITSELKVARLDDLKLQYEALSYTWGYEEPTEKMWIQNEEQQPSQRSPQPPPQRSAPRAVQKLQDHTREIMMERERMAPKTFYVRPNLSDALRHLRDYSAESYDTSQRKPQTMILWIDAICINQENEEEKSHQVAKMAQIYRCASGVFIWLGKESEESNIGMDFVTRIPTLEHQGMLSVKGSSAQQWSAFISLMKREWFSRRWVVQELALAKESYLACGDSVVHWEDFVIAVEFFIVRFDTINALYNDSAEFKQKLLSLGDIKASGAGKMISVTNEFVRGSGERRKTLEALVSELTMFEVGDPRDTVYALIPLAWDMQDGSERIRSSWRSEAASRAIFEVDYKKNILQVFKDFIAFCVIRSDSLDILCRKWAPQRRIKRLKVVDRVTYYGRRPPAEEIHLPSWIGLLKESAFGMPHAGPQTRVAGDSLVDTPDNQRYNASRGRRAEILFGERETKRNEDFKALDLRSKDLVSNPSTFKVTAGETLETNPGRESDGTLYVRGLRVDSIQQISHRLFEGLIPREWLALGGWTEESYGVEASDIPEELWRTLVADRAPGGKDPPRWYSVALSWAIERRNSNGDIHTAELIRQGQPQRMVEFLKRVQEVIWDKRFFLLSGRTSYRLGIAPSGAQEGDILCVLLGCSVPVVLRPLDKSDPRCGYKLVGEAYIHGVMDGEALALGPYAHSDAKDIKEKSEEFCLV